MLSTADAQVNNCGTDGSSGHMQLKSRIAGAKPSSRSIQLVDGFLGWTNRWVVWLNVYNLKKKMAVLECRWCIEYIYIIMYIYILNILCTMYI